MTADQKAEFEFITKSLSELAMAASQPLTQRVASALRGKLADHITQVFPELSSAMSNLPAAPSANGESVMKKVGPKLWSVLHTRAKSKPTDTAAELKWLQDFAAALPCPVCAKDMADYLVSNPPDFNDYQGWMIRFHNAVNAKRGVALMPEDQARALWK